MRSALKARVLTLPAAAIVAMGLMTGCGGSGSDSSTVASVNGEGGSSGGGGSDKSDAEQSQEFVNCMRDNGVDMEDPDPETGQLDLQSVMGGGADSEALRTAMEACRDKAPQAMKERGEGNPDAAQLENMKKFAACMRENGVDMDDPGPEGLDRDSMNMSDPNFQDAMGECSEFLGGMMGGQK
ncbi:hypothetical protein NLX86_08995 [Streptomyces sp. A3M-1-3]|uniref:hypothetical protein n=1 Tax=Streptomyces sp. A3M-1-3 TaxID=2962044 RepID=UPI0020B8BC7A|nr:hypothetical protein [Streptomyces sp. A3M-1-3]MCP3818246.1 hypothetical protein [Streptomyces sp. A3M-1-3]